MKTAAVILTILAISGVMYAALNWVESKLDENDGEL
jgi:hypothetical protein